MSRSRSLLGSVALSAAAGLAAGLAWGGVPAEAAAAAQTATTAQTAAAASATVDSSLSIPVSGSATAADGSRVTFSGFVVVSGSAVTDVVGVPPFVMLTFDCSNVTATSGSGAKKVTYDTRGYQVVKIRELQPTDVITMTAPYDQLGAGLTLASQWQVTATLNFSPSGQLTSGTITASSAATAAQ
jgi:hypothetical protein